MSEPVTFLTNLDEERIIASASRNDEWTLLSESEIIEEQGPTNILSKYCHWNPTKKLGIYISAKPPAGTDLPNGASISLTFICDSAPSEAGATVLTITASKQSNFTINDTTLFNIWVEVEVNKDIPTPIWRGFSNGSSDAVRLVSYDKSKIGAPLTEVQLRTSIQDAPSWYLGAGTVIKLYCK